MDTTTSDINREVADCMLNLRVISRIPTNHKLNVNSKTYSNANSNIDALWRTFYEETGDKTIDFINKTIDESIKACQKYPQWIELIADDVCNILNALTNLRQIYERDNKESIVGKIDLIKNRINRERFLRTCKDIKVDTIPSKPLPIPTNIIKTGPSGIAASITPCNSCAHTPSPAPI